MLRFAPLHPLRQGLERASMAIVRQGARAQGHNGRHPARSDQSVFFGLQLPLKIASLLSLNFRELLMVENCPWPASVKSTVSPALGQDSKVWSSIGGLSQHCLLKSRHSVARYEAVVASH